MEQRQRWSRKLGLRNRDMVPVGAGGRRACLQVAGGVSRGSVVELKLDLTLRSLLSTVDCSMSSLNRLEAVSSSIISSSAFLFNEGIGAEIIVFTTVDISLGEVDASGDGAALLLNTGPWNPSVPAYRLIHG